MQSADATVAIYTNPIPPTIESEMEHLYQHRYASYIQFKTYGQITENTRTYVSRVNGKVAAALVFALEKNKVIVLNEQMRIDEHEIDRFAHHIFSTYKYVHVISFPVIQADVRRLSFPHQQAHATLDIVLALPSTVEEYLGKLGKSTRNYVKRYLNKLKRDHPSFSFKVYVNEEIRESDVRDIIALNRMRMEGRAQSSYIDNQEEQRMLSLLKSRGFVGVATIDGRVCAGTINYRFGDNYFLQVVAHDPMYNEYGLGTLCCYLTICACIAERGSQYHFLWGQYEYKYRLLGVQRDLDHLAVYRSYPHLLVHAPAALKIAFGGYRYSARNWLLRTARNKDDGRLMSRLVFHVFHGLREVKRVATRFLRRQGNAVG